MTFNSFLVNLSPHHPISSFPLANRNLTIIMSEKQENFSPSIDTLAEIIDLEIDSEYRSGVEENFANLTEIAQLVMEFPLDASIEIAPKFEP